MGERGTGGKEKGGKGNMGERVRSTGEGKKGERQQQKAKAGGNAPNSAATGADRQQLQVNKVI